MRILKWFVISLFVIVSVVFIIFMYSLRTNTDYTMPAFQSDSDMIEVSVDATREDLMKGIVVKDGKDGDLTNNVIIEKISKFTDNKEHICRITYVVEDADNHVAKYTRNLKYKNYTSPKFKLKEPLIFKAGEPFEPIERIQAIDSIEGDISERVRILTSSISTGATGTHPITAQVTNSMGDTVKLNITALTVSKNVMGPEIKLKEYLVYVKQGDGFEPRDYIDSIEDHQDEEVNFDSIEVEGEVNTKESGTYQVTFTATDKLQYQGQAILTVIVEGK